jgi:hypothetical protein
VLVVNYPAGVRFDAARRGASAGDASAEFDQTDVFGESGLWQWMAARKGAAALRIYALNNVVFDAPEVVIPVHTAALEEGLRIELGPGPFRSYLNGRLLQRGQQGQTTNQPFAVTRRELRVKKGEGRLFVFDGRDGQLLEPAGADRARVRALKAARAAKAARAFTPGCSNEACSQRAEVDL